MTQIQKDSYKLVYKVGEILGESGEEKEKRVEAFEKEVFARLINAAVKKLPEQEREPIVKLANNAENEEQVKALHTKLKDWFNDQEIVKLFTKMADELLTEMVGSLYKTATEEQKKKFEEVFKKEALTA